MREADEEALRRYTLIRTLHLTAAGRRRCRGCGQGTESIVKRPSASTDTKPRCLDCWKALRSAPADEGIFPCFQVSQCLP